MYIINTHLFNWYIKATQGNKNQIEFIKKAGNASNVLCLILGIEDSGVDSLVS